MKTESPHTNTTNTPKRSTNDTSTQEPDPGSYILEIAYSKRCSRPLCSSQTTTPYHATHTPKHASGHDQENQKHKYHHEQQDKSLTTRASPVASGPNSVPNTTHNQTPANFPQHTPPAHPSNRRNTPKAHIRTRHQRPETGTYSLIFHP